MSELTKTIKIYLFTLLKRELPKKVVKISYEIDTFIEQAVKENKQIKRSIMPLITLRCLVSPQRWPYCILGNPAYRLKTIILRIRGASHAGAYRS
ncbi:MAG: hypothetical protein QXS79_03725 [Candidatus Bathyarchaeia archaeon]